MPIDIRGTTTANKGAQLMLEAIAERLDGRCELSCPTPVIDWDVRARLAIRQDLQVNRFPMLSSRLSDLVPQVVKERYGLVATKDVQGVLDASGFAYSDFFGPRVAQTEARYSAIWQSMGTPKVILPQAFGPFNNPEVASATRRIVNESRVVFVRDEVSGSYLDDLRVRAPLLRAPDFTIGLPPDADVHGLPETFAVIVPNNKMITKGGLSQGDYIASMTRFGDAARSSGLDVVVVCHERSDARLATELARLAGFQYFSDERPRKLKGAISRARVVIASRFHAAVAGLATGVPTITVGWSHKYESLMGDFGVRHWAYERHGLEAAHMREVLEDREGMTSICVRGQRLRKDVEAMWRRAEMELGV